MVKIKKYIEDKKINSSLLSLDIIGKKKHSPVAGANDGAKDSTITRYKPVWLALRNFCLLIGDYVSAMILWRGVCPQNPYPMDLGTAKLSLRFKTSPLGTPIVHPDTR